MNQHCTNHVKYCEGRGEKTVVYGPDIHHLESGHGHDELRVSQVYQSRPLRVELPPDPLNPLPTQLPAQRAEDLA